MLKFLQGLDRDKLDNKAWLLKEVKKVVKKLPSKYRSGAQALHDYIYDNMGKLPKRELYKVYTQIDEIYPHLYALNTVNVKFSELRVKLASVFGRDSEQATKSQTAFGISKEDKQQIKDDYVKKVKAKNEERIEMLSSDIIATNNKMLASNTWQEEVLGLLLASGARPVEMLTRNVFEESKAKKGWIRVSNLAKKRRAKTDSFTERPLLALKPQEFITRVHNLREEINKVYPDGIVDEKSNQLLPKVSAALRLKAKNYYPEHPTTRFLRQLYANCSYVLYANKRTNPNVWISSVLGHNETDLATSFSYSIIKVDDVPADTENLTDITVRVDKLEDDVKELKVEQPVIRKLPHTRGTPERQKMALVKEKIQEMKDKGLPLTSRSVKKYVGVSTETALSALKEYRAENMGN